MNGPFFSERPICLGSRLSAFGFRPFGFRAPREGAPTLFLSPLNDELVRRLAITCLVPLGRQAPRRYRMPAAGRLALAAAERMVDRIHRHAAHVGALPQPAAAARLSDGHVLVIEVADLPDRGEAL